MRGRAEEGGVPRVVRPFQFSIGDAQSITIHEGGLQKVKFQFSIGDAACRQRTVGQATGVRFQFSIGDAKATTLLHQVAGALMVSILYWRCHAVEAMLAEVLEK